MNKRFSIHLNIFYLIAPITRNYFTNISLIVNNFILPCAVFFIMALILNKGERIGLALGVALSGILAVGCLSFAINFFEWRNSVIYKKIKISLASSLTFFVAFVCFYFVICLLIFWFLISFMMFFEYIHSIIDSENNIQYVKNQIELIPPKNWKWIFIGLVQLSLISIAIGCFIGLILKNSTAVQAMSLMIYLLTAFITSCYIPLVQTAGVDFIRYAGNITPAYSSIHMIQAAWLENISFENFLDPEYVGEEHLFVRTANKDGLKGLEFLNIASETDAKEIPNEIIRVGNGLETRAFKYSYFSVFSDYKIHAIVGAAWIAFLSIFIWIINRYKPEQRN